MFALLPAIATSMTRIPSMVAIALGLSVVGVGGGNVQSPDFDADLAVFGPYVDALARQARIPGLSSAVVRRDKSCPCTRVALRGDVRFLRTTTGDDGAFAIHCAFIEMGRITGGVAVIF
jgi:hypothetical protein